MLYNEKHFKETIKDFSTENKSFVNKAYNFSKKAHEWQKRKSWEDYFIHPLFVWIFLWEKFQDINLLVAWLLHDTVEDNEEIKIETIYEEFGMKIGYLVDSVTKTQKRFLGWKEIFEDERNKILAWWMKDISCILLKLADREHNLATLCHMPSHKQIKKSFESQSIYLPLMNLLDFHKLNSIEEIRKKFFDFIEKECINSVEELRKKLLDKCFINFNEEIFNIVYNNSSNIIWEINDENIYEKLLENKLFAKSIKIFNMSYNMNNFSILFAYKKWFTLQNENNFVKFGISNIYNW